MEQCVVPIQGEYGPYRPGVLELGEHIGQKKTVIDRQLARKVVQSVENLCDMRHFADMCDSSGNGKEMQ